MVYVPVPVRERKESLLANKFFLLTLLAGTLVVVGAPVLAYEIFVDPTPDFIPIALSASAVSAGFSYFVWCRHLGAFHEREQERLHRQM